MIFPPLEVFESAADVPSMRAGRCPWGACAWCCATCAIVRSKTGVFAGKTVDRRYPSTHACPLAHRRCALRHRRHRRAREPEELEAARAHHLDAHIADRARARHRPRRGEGSRRPERAGHRADAVQRPPRRMDADHGAGAPLVGPQQLLAHAPHRDGRSRLHDRRRLWSARARHARRERASSSTSRTSRRAARSTMRSRTSRRSSCHAG